MGSDSISSNTGAISAASAFIDPVRLYDNLHSGFLKGLQRNPCKEFKIARKHRSLLRNSALYACIVRNAFDKKNFSGRFLVVSPRRPWGVTSVETSVLATGAIYDKHPAWNCPCLPCAGVMQNVIQTNDYISRIVRVILEKTTSLLELYLSALCKDHANLLCIPQ